MQVFALGILVIQLAARDGSADLAPLYLGLTGLARAIPGLALTIIAGAVADRSDRRRLLLVTQGVMSINASLLALVTVLGTVTLWHVLVAAAVQSAAFAFDAPGRHSMLPRLVPPRAMASAIGLQSAAFNGAQVVGPLAAGLLFFPIGVAGLLIINAASFIAILFALVAMAPIPRLSEPKHSVLRSVGHGMGYLKTNSRVMWLLSLTAVALFCTGSFVALLPAVAGDIAFLGTSWLSVLIAAVGVGALVGSFGLMRLGHSRHVGRIYAGATLFNGLAIVFFALSLHPAFALLTAFASGLAGTLMTGLANTMLQGAITDQYRGRIMSMFSFMIIGLMPAGQLVLGAIGTPLGIHAALIVAGSVAFVVGLFGAVRVHVVRDWAQTEHVAAPHVRVPVAAPRALAAAPRVPVAADSREAVGGMTPTYTLGEVSALK